MLTRKRLFGLVAVTLGLFIPIAFAHYFGIVPLTNQTPIVLTASAPVTSAPQVTQLSADYVCTNAANQVQGAPASARSTAFDDACGTRAQDGQDRFIARRVTQRTTTTTTQDQTTLTREARAFGGSTLRIADAQAQMLVISGGRGGSSAPPEEDDGLGNFWFDADGGTCTRQSTAGAYIDAQACPTLNAAYAVASCDDVIRVVYADYSGGADADQQITEDASASMCVGADIRIRPEVGTRPIFRHVRFGSSVGNCANDGPDNIHMSGFAVVWGVDIEQDSDSITIDDFTGGSFGMGGGICGAPNNVPPSNITIKNSEWGPCRTAGGTGFDCRNQYTDAPQEGKNKISDGASDVLIENNEIHDFEITDAAHFECIWVGGGHNVTIRRNKIYNCETSGIAMPDTEATGIWLIENNWFGDVSPGNAAMKYGLAGGCPPDTHIIRANSFSASNSVGNEESGGCSNIHVIGNILGENYNCVGGTWRFNLVLGEAGCHESDMQISSLPYVNTSGGSSMDYHLTGVTDADSFVDAGVTNGGITEDYDQDARNGASSAWDAGADER